MCLSLLGVKELILIVFNMQYSITFASAVHGSSGRSCVNNNSFSFTT